MIYFFVLTLTLYFVFRYDICKKKKGLVLSYKLLLILAVLIMGCRYVVGGDTVRYIRYFDFYPKLGDEMNLFSYVFFDPGWLLLNSIIKTVYDDFIFFQFVHAVLLNGFVFFFIWKKTKYRFTVVLFYFLYQYLYFNTEILRESLAVICFLFASDYYIDKKWSKYYLVVSIAFLFHSSAFILFLYPFCRYIRFSYLNIFLMLVGNILLWGYLNDIFSYLFVNPLIAQKFEYYQGLGMNINGKILRFVEYVLFPFILVYYNRKKLLGKIDKYDPIYMLYFFIATTMVANTAIAGRMINYIVFYMLLYYVDALYRLRLPQNLLAFVFFFTLPILPNANYYAGDLSYVRSGLKSYHRWYPYTDIFHRFDKNQKNIVEQRIEDADRAMELETSFRK